MYTSLLSVENAVPNAGEAKASAASHGATSRQDLQIEVNSMSLPGQVLIDGTDPASEVSVAIGYVNPKCVPTIPSSEGCARNQFAKSWTIAIEVPGLALGPIANPLPPTEAFRNGELAS